MNKQTPLRRVLTLTVASLTFATVAGCKPAQPPLKQAPLAGAKIGGTFTLTDHLGQTVTDQSWNGKWRIHYFGYTYCPDICPVDAQKLMQGLVQFEKADPKRGASIVPTFITVDPARDTPATLKAFVVRYHPRLIGLTGTPEQIADVTRKFAVFYQKQEGSAPDRYLMGHSQMAFLMDPQGKPVALLPLDDPSTEADEGAPAKVKAELDRWVR